VKYNPAVHHRRSIRLKGYDYSSAGAYFITAVLQHRAHLFGSVNENGVQLSEAGKIAHRCWEEIPNHFPNTAVDEFVIMPDHMHGIVVVLEEGREEIKRDKNESNDGGEQLDEDKDSRGGVQLNKREDNGGESEGNGGGVQLNEREGNGGESEGNGGGVQLNEREGNGGGVQLNAATRAFISSATKAPIYTLPILNTPPQTRKDNYFSIISPKKKTLAVIIRTYKAAVTTICRENGIYEFQWQRNYYERIIRDDEGLAAVRRYIFNNPAKWLNDRKNQNAI